VVQEQGGLRRCRSKGALEAAAAYLHRKKGEFEQDFAERETTKSRQWTIT